MKKLLFIFGFLFFSSISSVFAISGTIDNVDWTCYCASPDDNRASALIISSTPFPFTASFSSKIYDSATSSTTTATMYHNAYTAYCTNNGYNPSSDCEYFTGALINSDYVDPVVCMKNNTTSVSFSNFLYKITDDGDYSIFSSPSAFYSWDGVGFPDFCGEETCTTDSSLCENQTDCENSGWYWNEYYDVYGNLFGECLDDDPCPTNWNDCHDQTRCEDSDWFWNQWLADNVKCRETSECDIEPSGSVTYDDVLAMCSTKKSCEDQGGTWFYDSSLYFGGICLVGPEENQLYKTKGTFINPVSLFTSYVFSDDKNIKNFAFLTTKILYKPFLLQGNILPALYVDDSYYQSTCFDSYTIELEDEADNIFVDTVIITYNAQRYLKEYESELTSEEELGSVYLRCRDPELEPNRSYDLDTLDDTDEFIFNSDAFLPLPNVRYDEIDKYCLAGEYLDVYILSSYCQYYGNDHDQENGGVRGQFTVEIQGDFGVLSTGLIDSTCPFASFLGLDFCEGWEAVKNGGTKFFESLITQITEVLTKISKFFLPFREDGTQICIQTQDGFLCNTYDYANKRGLVDIVILLSVMSAFFFSLFFPKL